MQTIDDFFNKYNLEAFYEHQAQTTQKPVKPFRKDRHKKLSFGIIPGFRNYDLFYERYLSAVKILQEKNLLKDNIKILDIGSGEGCFKFFFDALCSQKIEWQGVEVWKERAEFCRHIGYTIHEESLENGQLLFNDEEFDLVLASHVIEHLPNPSQIVKEMGRVLKKGGIIIIGTPTKPPGIAQIDSWYHRRSQRGTGDTQQAFTHNTLQKMVLQALNLNKEHIIDKRGFRIISGRKKLPFENWRWFYNLSVYLGKKMLLIVPEINLIIQK